MKKNAIKIFGLDIVNDVLLLVSISDVDGTKNLFQDEGKDKHLECLEYLFY